MADPATRDVAGFAAVLAAALAVSFAAGSATAQGAEPPPADNGGIPAGAYLLSTPLQSPGDEAGRQRASDQARRARLSEEMACADASIQTYSAERARAEVEAWGAPEVDDPRYRPLQVVWRAPVARYPDALLSAGTPGAVGLLLFIDAEGRVARTEALCATDPAFVAMAEQMVRTNRYSPSTFEDRPIRDTAYQVVGYGVAED